MIQVNPESLGTFRTSTANRKHCLVNDTNVGQCQQLMPVNHVVLDVHQSDRATTSAVTRGAGLLTPRAKWVSTLTLVANEVWRRGFATSLCVMIVTLSGIAVLYTSPVSTSYGWRHAS